MFYMGKVKKGIDISYYQSNVDFAAVKASGIEFVIIREGYRMTTDKKFFEYVRQCKEAGLKILGIYHFAYAFNEKDSEEEAKYCVANLQAAGLDKDTIVFYDFEYDTVKKAAASGVTLGKNECNAHTITFCETVEKLGYKPGVYTNLDYYKNWYRKDVLSRWTIWLADYTDGPDFDCLVQQYTSKGSVPGIQGNVDLDYLYDEEIKMEANALRSRNEVIKLADSWLGKNEADGSYKEIIDIYNSFDGPFPRGAKMQYGWAWCACTWSALAVKLGYTDIMPIEISCGYLIEEAKKKGIWQENDSYVPSPGDAILYDWNDNGVGDNTGWPDHVGTVEYVNKESGYMIVVEGNYSDSVKKRTISLNGKYIRGFITPKYDLEDSYVYEESTTNGTASKKDINTIAKEVIAGVWDKGSKRKELLEANGYNYSEIQSLVNQILNGSATTTTNPTQDQSQPISDKVVATCVAKNFDGTLAGGYQTTANLHCRNDAGSNKKSLCVIPKGTKVKCYGYYNVFNGVKWPYIRFTMDGVQYTGFSSISYLEK